MASTKKQTEFTCGGCGHVWTQQPKGGQGVACPKCDRSDQLSSRTVKAKEEAE